MSATDLLARWNACGYYRLVGMTVVHADARSSELRITIGDEHLQAYGSAHGGIVAGLIDAAMGLAVLGGIAADEGCATIQMTANFAAPAMPGPLTATGRLLHRGRRVAVASAEAHGPDGRLVAVGQGTFQRFPLGAGA
jgi:uncharacterized protein (TIGR00369 family)